MAESLGSAVLDLSVDESGLTGGLSKAEGTTKSRMGKIGGIIGKGAMAAGAGLAAAGAAAVGAAFKTAAYGDEVAKTSVKLGVTGEALQEMRVWADRNGMSAQSLDRAVGRLNQRIGRAAEGNEKYADAFATLGVEITDSTGKVRDTESVMQDTIAALRDIEDPALQSARASEIFGTKMARDLMPALQDGSLSLEDAASLAHELGIVMDEDALAAAERFTDGWANLKAAATGWLHQAGAPVMTFMADKLFPAIQDKIVPALRSFGQWLGPKLAAAARVASDIFDNVVMPAFQALSAWWQVNGPAITARVQELGARAGEVFQAVAAWVTGTLIPAVARIVAWWKSNGPAILARLDEFRQRAGAVFDTVSSAVDAFMGVVSRVFDTVIGWFRSGTKESDNTRKQMSSTWDQLRKTTETIWNAVSDVISATLSAIRTVVETVTAIVRGIWDRWGADIMAFAQRTWDNIMQVVDGALQVIQGLFDIFAGLFTGDWSRVWEGVKSVFSGIWDAIGGILDQVLNTLSLVLTVFLDTVREVWNAAWGWVRDKVSEIWTAIIERVRSAAETVRAAIDAAIALVQQVWSEGWRVIREALSAAWEAITGRVSDGVNSVVEFFTGLPGRIIEALSGLAGHMLQIGKDAINALLDGIKTIGSRIGETIKGFFDIDLPSIRMPFMGDGPGAPPGPGGRAIERARHAAAGLPIRMSSSYRDPAHNRRVGGSPTSYHLDRANPASDWVGPTWALDEFARRLRRAGGWRELLWRVPNHAPGDNPHVHVAHDGGWVTANGMVPLRADELLTKLQVGETVLPAGFDGAALGGGGGGPVNVRVFIGDRELTDLVDVRIDERGREAGRDLQQASRQRVIG